MNKNTAKSIAETITNEQLSQMFAAAKEGIKDWSKVSVVNKGMTKGVAWNILAKDFDLTKNYHILAKINMVREFGDFLPDELKPKKKESGTKKAPFHQDPDFSGTDFFDF